MLNRAKLRKIFIISLIFITFLGCNENDDWIPNVRVEIQKDLNTQLANLGVLEARKIDGFLDLFPKKLLELPEPEKGAESK